MTTFLNLLCLDFDVLSIVVKMFFVQKVLYRVCLLTGLELLLGLLGSTNTKQQLDGAAALYKLANKSMALSPVEAAPPSPTQRVSSRLTSVLQYITCGSLIAVFFLCICDRFISESSM